MTTDEATKKLILFMLCPLWRPFPRWYRRVLRVSFAHDIHMLNCYSYSTLKDNIFVGFIVFLRVFTRITYLRQVIDESHTVAKKLSSDTGSYCVRRWSHLLGLLNLEGNETGLTYQRFQCHLGKACTPKKGKNTSNEPLQTIKLEYIQKC